MSATAVSLRAATGLTCLFLLLAGATSSSAAPRFSVNGQPICGSFAVKWLADELRDAQAAGINPIFCYDKRAIAGLLDPTTELGKVALDGRTKVMANFLRYAGSARLSADAAAEDPALVIAGAKGLPESGLLWVDEEAISYTQRDDTGVGGCQRGAEGTSPAAHPVGTFLFEEGTLREELDRCKDSPNLWGFWVLDDKQGNQLPALRTLYRLIRKYDVDDEGRPYNHVVVAGFASVESLTNFARDVCDMAGIYIYPSHRGTHHVTATDDLLRQMVPTIRERDPDAGIIGIYQAFHGPKWEPKPTPLQVRQQVRDFLRWGASGVMGYSWRMVEGYNTLRNLPDLREEVERIGDELRSGRLEVERDPPEVEPEPEFEANTADVLPVLRFEPDTAVSQPSKGLAVRLGPLAGAAGTWLHLDFEQYQEGGNQWPGIAFNRDAGAYSISDWSPFGAFVVRVANLLPTDSEIGATIHGPAGMWARYYPLPRDTVHDVVVDLAEVSDVIATSAVRRFSVIMRRPPVPTRLALEGVYLAPVQFETLEAPQLSVPQLPGALAAEGADEAGWQQAVELSLSDGTGEPPLKPCSVRLGHTEGRLHLRFECSVPDAALLRGATTEADAAMAGEDLVEVLLGPGGHDSVARLRVNPKGAVRDEMLSGQGSDLRWRWGAEVASRVENGQWVVAISLPLTAWNGAAGEAWAANFRRLDTELRPLAWVPETKPGCELLGQLRLARSVK